MEALVVAAVLVAGWTVVRAVHSRRRADVATAPAWCLAVLTTALVAWLAVSELTVSSAELERTVSDVSVLVNDPQDGTPGPLALLSGAQLALGTELWMEDLGGYDEGDARITSYEVSDRVLGVQVGTACVEERVAGDLGDGARSYQVASGRCE